MRGSNLAIAFRAVSDVLAASGLADLGGAVAAGPEAVTAVYGVFAAKAHGLGPGERDVVAAFGLGDLFDPAWWSGLVVFAHDPARAMTDAASLAAFEARIVLAAAAIGKLAALEGGDARHEAGMVCVVLHTDDGGPPAPSRLASAVEAVALLWDVLGDLAGQRRPLALAGFEPEYGATIRFDGDAGLMAELKALFLSIWEQVLLHHDLSLEARMSAIPSAIAIMDQIAASHPRDAVALRRRVRDGVHRVLATGASIPEMRIPDRFTPAELMRPTIGAVMDGLTPAPDPAVIPSSELAAIIAEERRALALASLAAE